MIKFEGTYFNDMIRSYLKPHPVGDFEDLAEKAHPKFFHVKVVDSRIKHDQHIK